MSNDLVPASSSGWWFRAVSGVSLFVRATLASMGVSKVAPPAPGVSLGRVARKTTAQADLSQITLSPAVYAAVQRRAIGFGNYPVKVFEGTGNGQAVDPERVPWAASLLRLLATPDPADLGALFPVTPGEGMVAQLVADLLLTGVAYVIPTRTGDAVTGLTRAHPQSMTLTDGGETWEYRPNAGGMLRYPRRTVCCLRLVSWAANGAGQLGTGAGEVLAPYVDAERRAMEQTRDRISQGGVDILVTGKTPVGVQFMSNPANREQVVNNLVAQLTRSDGQRVIGLGGDLDLKDAGFTPADIQAPELTAAAREAELMALGTTAVAVGLSSGAYADAVMQYRVQAELDEGIAAIFEAYMLRPLAQAFAKRGGHPRPETVTARIDLSSHPGWAYVRDGAIARMERLVGLGWSPEQAATIENMELPPPKGTPATVASPSTAPVKEPAQPPGSPKATSREVTTEGDRRGPVAGHRGRAGEA